MDADEGGIEETKRRMRGRMKDRRKERNESSRGNNNNNNKTRTTQPRLTNSIKPFIIRVGGGGG